MSTDTMPTAVKNSPRSNHKFVTYVYHLADCVSGNASFPNVTPSGATLKTLADALAQGNAAAKGGGPGVVAARDAKRQDLDGQVNLLVVNVQATVKAAAVDAATATAMILSTGLSVQKARVVNKPPLAAKHGVVSGDVLLAALAVAKTAVYYWSFSLDQKSWTSAPETMKARTTISGLTPGQLYYFRVQTKTRKAMSDYSDAVKLMVI